MQRIYFTEYFEQYHDYVLIFVENVILIFFSRKERPGTFVPPYPDTVVPPYRASGAGRAERGGQDDIMG